MLRGPSLAVSRVRHDNGEEIKAVLFVNPAELSDEQAIMLGLRAQQFHCDFAGDWMSSPPTTCSGGWSPGVHLESTLLRPVVTMLGKGGTGVEIAGVGSDGQLYSSEVVFKGSVLIGASTKAFTQAGPFLAATAWCAGQVAAVTAKSIQWLRRGQHGFSTVSTKPVELPTAIACFPHHKGRELIVVCGDGAIVRVPE